MRRTLLACLAVAAIMPATATPLLGTFGGNIDHVFLNPSGTNDAFGLGIALGDSLSGTFAYDSVTGNALHFNANVGSQTFSASNVSVSFDLFDGFLTSFHVKGEIASGLFMFVGLTNGSPVFTDVPPQRLSSADWFISAFMINATGKPPIEANFSLIESIRSGTTNGNGSFYLTVDEPPAWTICAIALLPLLGRMPRRR
jgi:hypothetical protein